MRKLSQLEIKEIQIDLLEEVTSYCKENQIKYFLAYGTLLGAVRHKGYIPWDDDIDLILKRPDYERFIHSFNRKNSKYKVHAYELDDKFLFPFAKVSNEETILVENTLMKTKIGINIDIFVIDSIMINDKKTMEKRDKLHKIYNLKILKYKKDRGIIKNLMLYFGKTFFSWLTLKRINKMMIKNAKTYDYGSSEYVCNLSFGYGQKPIHKSVFQDQIELIFEGEKYTSMKKYDQWLTNIYGDYMQLPKKKKRVTHHDYNAYIKK